MNRYRNGRFKSKKDARLQKKLMLYTTMSLLTMALIFGFALQPWTMTYQNVYAEETQKEVTEEITAPASELDARISQAIADIPHQSSTTEEWIRYTYEYADEVGGDADRASHLIYCESMWYCGQSKIVKGDKREESFCLGQLHAPSHPHITWEQLNDPYYNIRYVIDNAGKDRWFGYNEKTDSCASGVAEYWK
jgi:hypothetical protein